MGKETARGLGVGIKDNGKSWASRLKRGSPGKAVGVLRLLSVGERVGLRGAPPRSRVSLGVSNLSSLPVSHIVPASGVLDYLGRDDEGGSSERMGGRIA